MNLPDIEKDLREKLEKATAGLKIIEFLKKSNTLVDNKVLSIVDGELFFPLISCYSAQSKAPVVEKFIASKLGYQLVPSSQGQGDFYDPLSNEYIELKVSFTNKSKNLNIRQIRPWQNVQKYLLMYIDEDQPSRSVLFILSKDQMNSEIKILGSHTHGTKEANKANLNHEFSITIPINDNNQLYRRWYNSYNDSNTLDSILSTTLKIEDECQKLI